MGKKLTKKVPELRFPKFEGDWITDRTDHFLVRYVVPVNVQPETTYREIGIRSHGKGIFHKAPVMGKALGNKRVYWVHSKVFTVNIVFAWEQAVALTSSNEEGYIASHRFLMFLPKKDRADLEFVLLFFLSKRGKYLLELASPGGAGRNKTLGQDNFAELEITLPNKKEQEKIANFLGAMDARLTQLRRKRDRLQTYKRGVMRKLFSQKIGFSGFNENWDQLMIEDVALVASGGTPDRSVPTYWNGNIPWITTSEIGQRFIENSVEKITIKGLKNSSAKIFPRNTILLAMYGQGKTRGQVSILKIEASTNQACAAIVTTGNYNSEFLYYFLFNEYEKLRKLSNDGSQKNLSASLIKKYKIPNFCLKDQEKIVDFLTAIDQKIEAISRQIDRTEQFKKGLLQKLFV